MSVIFSPASIAASGAGLSSRPRSGRGLAALLTAGAVLLALVLALAIPVRAEGSADQPRTGAPMTGYPGQ